MKWLGRLGGWGSITERSMWPHRVVVPPPTFNEDLGLQQRIKLLTGQQLVAKLPSKLSQQPFSQGDPGSINNVFTPIRGSHSRTFPAVNSGPRAPTRSVGRLRM